MSKNLKLLSGTATATELATLFGVSARTVREHAQAGVIIRAAEPGRFKLKPSVQNYAALLRKRVAQRKENPLEDSRARLLNAKASAAETKAKNFADKFLDRAEVDAQWEGMKRSIHSRLSEIPARVKKRLPHLDEHALNELANEVRLALAPIADEPEGATGNA